ncbi:protein translocase subunit SecD [Nocardioides euryhalodurans]|uniref:Multifunctional fusion protein n=1 Tax=Nocardioides euryhalodurans TaxID=2518370 RepID=A0A4P7GJU5_9ACTN|nr:protein translocase subunit SecD [Nocardioides euryhalodurans]QBR92290.1 protein translocase subunit SecD [Nocardioides euryhalodurans]
MSRGVLLRLLLVIGILAGAGAIAVNKEPELGLDLRGGAQFIFEVQSTEDTEATPENVDRTLEVLRGRVDALGVAESTLARQGDNRILVELPGITDEDEAAAAEERIGQTAQLEIRPVVGTVADAEAEPSAEGNLVLPTDQGDVIEMGPVALQGDQISGAEAAQPQDSVRWVVNVDFNGEGSDAFGELSAEAACAQGAQNRIAIVLDDRVISSPGVQVPCGSRITGSTEISGDFTLAEAQELSALIEGGALPLPLELISDRLVGPTLGEDAIDASFEAGLIGIILTGLFITLVYRFVGFLATVALASYALIAYAMLLALGATLTLPGLAGFVLAIGLAIDANVLVFERAREEYDDAPKAGVRRALGIGFNKAWSAIIDSNVTTLLAAGLLFVLATGPVQGFGVTLSIGVVASMISALVIARMLTEVGVSIPWVARRPRFTGLGYVSKVRAWLDRTNPDLMARRRTWLAASLAAMAIAVAGIVTQGLNLGIEFTGGRTLDYSLSEEVTVDEARDAIAAAGFPEAVVQGADTADVTVRTGVLSDEDEDRIEAALAEIGGDVTKEDDQQIGPSLGDELRDKALLAFGIALLAQMLYLAIRFKWTFGVAAVVAMFHDVLLVVGLFAWLGKPIDAVFLAAALTIVGLSVNDTVVVFDRIRERWRASRDKGFNEVANRACIETVPRTVNTGLGAMFILATLALLGGDSLQDFAIALLVGLVVGTYSSVFMATPLLTYLQEKAPMSREQKVRQERSPDDSGAVV